ncbi:hypothetical protein F4808DRAFT_412642 [Astrocystis sublimbata]|nr:hypothetical protein F4808DRAFT_412642 [Astrocystis sublimbata]
MLNIISFEMPSRTWAVTSKVLRRLSRDQPVFKNVDDTGAHRLTANTNDMSGRAKTETSHKTIEKLPLAVDILDDPSSVNQQLDCPLFAKLPAELREMIWDYTLAAYENLDALYPLNEAYARPGQAAPLRIAVELLLTCRAVYLEAFLVPFHNPMTVFDGHPDVVPPTNPLQCTPSNLRLCRKLRPWQFANITSLDVSVQQYMLEGGAIERVSRLSGNKGRHKGYETRGFTLAGYASFSPFKEAKTQACDVSLRPEAAATRATLIRSLFTGKKITHLTLRMSHTDWWAWTSCPQAGANNSHEALRLEPMINVTDRRETSTAMIEGHEARKMGKEPDFNLDEFEKQGRWGMQFAEHWPDLKTLELVLETYVQKESQLDTVIQCAKLWTFPLNDAKQLEWNGREQTCVRWRGANRYSDDSELGLSWPHDKPGSLASHRTPITQWRPATNDGVEAMPAQEFVTKSLVFSRRSSIDASGSLGDC